MKAHHTYRRFPASLLLWAALPLLALVLVQSNGRDVRAAFPGANGRLVYASGGILTQNPDGTCTQAVLTDQGSPYFPSWSADGKRIAFSGGTIGNWNNLVTMNADGSGVTILPNTLGDYDYAPDWSPDGTKLVFTNISSTVRFPNLYLIDADGTNRRPLTQTDSDAEQYPVWSPDGELIAFELAGDIYTIQPDGGGLTNLTNHPATDGWPDWSPDGLKLVFLSDRGGTPDELYVMNADGGNPAPLANPAYGETPVWSPDGTKIAYVRDRSTISIINADGSDRQDLGHGVFPDWQPDMRTITQLDVEKKVFMPQPPPSWGFSLTGIGPFQIPGTGGCKTFSDLESGAYTLQEEVVPDLIQSVSCSSGETGETEVQFNLSAGEHAICTFINGTLPRLEIVKEVVGPAPTAAWQFSGSDPLGAFELPAAGGNVVFKGLQPGQYTVSETPVAGYATSSNCTDFNVPDDNSFTVELKLGDSKICRFTNSKTADLTIEKIVVGPAPAADWHFYTYLLGEFNLPAAGGSIVFEDVLTDSYYIQETLDNRYSTSVECSDGSSGANEVFVSVAGEPVTCTFTNTFHEMAFLAYLSAP